MHYYVMVQVESDVYRHFSHNLETCVENALAPYDENRESVARLEKCVWCPDDSDCDVCSNTRSIITTCNPNAQWDWWQIGGRWSSLFHPDPNYKPGNDPRNAGKWPTEWVSDDIHNRATVAQLLALPDDHLALLTPHSIINTGGEWIDTNFPSVSSFRAFLEDCDATTLCVVVDCHR